MLEQSIVPVLTEQTVECAGSIEHGQIFLSLGRPFSTEFHGYTIRRKYIMIALHIGCGGRSSVHHNVPSHIHAHSTIAISPFRDSALIDTQPTGHSFFGGCIGL
jgi:hypothetical protein